MCICAGACVCVTACAFVCLMNLATGVSYGDGSQVLRECVLGFKFYGLVLRV